MCIRDRGRMGGEGRPSRIYCVDKCATNNYFLKFFVFPEEIRKGLIEFVPSAYNNFESVISYCDERELNREVYVEHVTELYNLNIEYEEWKESLEVYVNDNDYNDLIKIINQMCIRDSCYS